MARYKGTHSYPGGTIAITEMADGYLIHIYEVGNPHNPIPGVANAPLAGGSEGALSLALEFVEQRRKKREDLRNKKFPP